MIKGDKMKYLELNRFIEEEFEKYGLKPFKKENIDIRNKKTCKNSIGIIVATVINSAALKLVNHGIESFKERKIELPTRKNIGKSIKANYPVGAYDKHDSCDLLNRDPEIPLIDIRIVSIENKERKKWDATKITIKNKRLERHEIFEYSTYQIFHNIYDINMSNKKETQKTFQIILEEAKKIK